MPGSFLNEMSREVIQLRSHESTHIHFRGEIKITLAHGAIAVSIVGPKSATDPLPPGETFYAGVGRHTRVTALMRSEISVECSPSDVDSVTWVYRGQGSVA
jgi:hypothetical protein